MKMEVFSDVDSTAQAGAVFIAKEARTAVAGRRRFVMLIVTTGPRQYTAWPFAAKYQRPPRCVLAITGSTGVWEAVFGATRKPGIEKRRTPTTRVFIGSP